MKRAVEGIIRFTVDLLFPPRCAFCGEIIPPGTQVCRECAKDASPSGTVRMLSACNGKRSVRCAALYPYEGKARESLLRYKFHGEAQSGKYYAAKLAGLVKLVFPGTAFTLVTWVPLSEKRKKERGYDQAERLARPLAEALGVPCAPCLRKAGENRVQHLLRREERAGNVRGVYLPDGKNPAAGQTVLLVDDIVTTGATLAECAEVLLCAGAADVFCAAAAHADMEWVEKSKMM